MAMSTATTYPTRQVWQVPFCKGVRSLKDAPQETLPNKSGFDTSSLVIMTKEGLFTDLKLTRHAGVNRQTGALFTSFIRVDEEKNRIPFLVHYAYK